MNGPIINRVLNEKLIVDRRDRIISAAITLFRRSGFHVAKTKDIAGIWMGEGCSILYSSVGRPNNVQIERHHCNRY
jgi:hypothetical protein